MTNRCDQCGRIIATATLETMIACAQTAECAAIAAHMQAARAKQNDPEEFMDANNDVVKTIAESAQIIAQVAGAKP